MTARPRRAAVAVVVVLVVAALQPLVASVAVSAGSWRPVGDSAVLVLRSTDVGGDDTPLVGMPTTLGASAGRSLHHPGPSELWLLAPAARSGRWGAVLAVVVLSNAVALAVTVVALLRVGGLRVAAVGGAFLAAACASVAADTLVDPLNPNFGLLPYAAFLAASLAAVQRSGRWWYPVAAVFGSLAAQAHVTLAVLVGAGALVALLSVRRPRSGVRSAPFAAGVVVLAALWAPVLVDQVGGSGNAAWLLEASLTGASSSSDVGLAGWDHAARVLAHGLGRPAWAGAADGLATVATQPVHRYALAGLVLVVLAGVAVVARRSAGGAAARLLLGSLAVGALATSRMPGAFHALVARHNYLWLWVLAAGASAVIVLVATRRVSDRAVVAGGVVGSVVAAVVVLAGPAEEAVPPWTPAVDRATPIVLDALGGEPQTVVMALDPEFRRFAVAAGLALDLERAGHAVVVPEGFVGSFGPHRSLVGRRAKEVDATVVLTSDDSLPAVLPAGAEPISRHRDELGVTTTVWLSRSG